MCFVTWSSLLSWSCRRRKMRASSLLRLDLLSCFFLNSNWLLLLLWLCEAVQDHAVCMQASCIPPLLHSFKTRTQTKKKSRGPSCWRWWEEKKDNKYKKNNSVSLSPLHLLKTKALTLNIICFQHFLSFWRGVHLFSSSILLAKRVATAKKAKVHFLVSHHQLPCFCLIHYYTHSILSAYIFSA